MPLGLALGSLSGISGRPVESENRTVTGVDAALKCGALESAAAAGVGVNVPVSSTPLAWAGRKPGCRPKSWSNCSINASLKASSFSSVGNGMVSTSEPLYAKDSPP